ncbi:MBL fold metallo-hydrolase, partial [Nonomuraea sp. FMUSA5-5]|nr:MBL fold metallo-hydrolase [Nonomuraea sp. FMUSA5-5]
SHYGPVHAVRETLERSAEELRVWVDLTRRARSEGMDLDHAVAMVRDRTKERYHAMSADEATAEQFELLNGASSNVAGIMHWLNRVSP